MRLQDASLSHRWEKKSRDRQCGFQKDSFDRSILGTFVIERGDIHGRGSTMISATTALLRNKILYIHFSISFETLKFLPWNWKNLQIQFITAQMLQTYHWKEACVMHSITMQSTVRTPNFADLDYFSTSILFTLSLSEAQYNALFWVSNR